MTAIIYPIAGHWVWGGGWLSDLGLQDFAGSAVIHALGGFSALAAAILIGPRKGKFTSEGLSSVALPSNLPLASVGAFLLWFGWFGFNAGSTLDRYRWSNRAYSYCYHAISRSRWSHDINLYFVLIWTFGCPICY